MYSSAILYSFSAVVVMINLIRDCCFSDPNKEDEEEDILNNKVPAHYSDRESTLTISDASSAINNDQPEIQKVNDNDSSKFGGYYDDHEHLDS